MELELLDLVLNLKEEIKNSQEYKDLIISEEKMSKSEEVMVLSYRKDMSLMNYEDGLKHFPKNSQELLNLEKNLAESTYNLNNHPLVKDYKDKLDKLNLLYKEVEEIIFKGIK